MKKMIIPLSIVTFIISAGCNQDKDELAKKTDLPVGWSWPDSLDALKAAADYHKLVFEDSTLRILEVVVPPGKLDPIHTHKGHSIVWVTHTSPIIYNTYDYDEKKSFRLIKKDTVVISPAELNRGMREKPEPPHSV
jgi:hypothetical protein